MDHAALARSLRAAAHEAYLRLASDPTLRKVAEIDRLDLFEIAETIKEGDLKGAAHTAARLDTAVRDAIPADVWAALFPSRTQKLEAIVVAVAAALGVDPEALPEATRAAAIEAAGLAMEG